MTTLTALVEQAPPATAGVTTQIASDAGGIWRHVIQLADPAAGSSVAWHDVTRFDARTGFAGYSYERSADSYGGRWRASVATLDLWADDDRFAPWNPDTSATYGVNLKQGPGLLIRSVIFHVVGGVVVDWNPRFTLKVESWGDASYSHGKRRQHRIVARDLLTSLVAVPLPAYTEDSWSNRVFHLLTDSGWAYGSLIYGAQYEADTTTPILVLPDRPASTSAVNEFDATLDPVGLIWYTDRYGHLVVRPRVEDTFHAAAFAAGATGDQLPDDVSPCYFTWHACSDTDFEGTAAYAVDSSDVEPFGLDETETAVINHVKISDPITAGFDDDDPISIQRYDRKTFAASWLAANDVVAADLLAFRANSTVEARPLLTTVELAGFMTAGPSTVDFLGYVAIDHRNNDEGLSSYANGYLRGYTERIAPHGCDLTWSLVVTVDVYHVTADAGLLPVEDLAVA